MPCILVFFMLTPTVFAQQDVLLTLDLGRDVEITRRWNYSTRLDGRYQGHINRESLLLLSRDGGPRGDGTFPYSGELMVSEETLRDSRTVAQRLAERRDASVLFEPSGEMFAPDGQRAPLFRAVPRFPDEPVAVGTRWEAAGIAQFYLEGDDAVAVPVLAEYTYEGVELYQGQQTHRIVALYALRAPLSRGQLGSHPARELMAGLPQLPFDYVLHGRHEATILLPVGGGPPVLHRTAIREQLRHPSGAIEERSGFILTWYRSAGDFDGESEAERIAERIRRSDVEDVTVRATQDNRVALSIQNLQFVADQAVLLPGEDSRLDGIADALRTVPDRTILIVGHTADIGTQLSQLELSFDRAERIVEELVRRGIAPGQLLYDGRGGTEPVADNDTETGRAANRRVEIEILPARQ
ncbi:MAG: OmpA family protein [Spirochaetales bacterium]|nr:OmpA family protein [Spirochaetales bacterium]